MLNGLIKWVARIFGDFFHFSWVICGVLFIFLSGLFQKRPDKEKRKAASEIISWTSRFVAPAAEKIVDYEIALKLFKEFYLHGEILDIGFGAGRFEKHALKPAIDAQSSIDGIDIEYELESSLKAFKNLSWVRNAWNRSFDDTKLPDEGYSYLFSNNAIMASTDLRRTFTELNRIAKPGAYFQFNLLTKRNAHLIYLTWITFWRILGNKRKMSDWQKKANNRIPTYCNIDEVKTLLEETGWNLEKIYPYFAGNYAMYNFIFNFPAYEWFWKYEANIQLAPVYYKFIKAIWTKLFLLVLPLRFEKGATIVSEELATKYYLVVRKHGSKN